MAMDPSIIKPTAGAEACAWFAEFRAEGMTADTRMRFDEWLRKSPEHIQAYLEVAAGWSELPTADPNGCIDIQALIARARESREENVVPFTNARGSQRHTGNRFWTPALAASFALLTLLFGAGLLFWTYHVGAYTTNIGEQRTLSLPDGSTVVLNALTTVRVRYSNTLREVDLIQGQAFFHDIEDPKRPFIVRMRGATVRAVGTQFDIDTANNAALVTVIEGKVAVADESSPDLPADTHGLPLETVSLQREAPNSVFVSAGQQLVVTAKLIEKPQRADIKSATAWLQGHLVFDDTPLVKVAAQFNLYSSRRLVITDPALQTIGVSGVYSSADPESLIGFLRAQPGLTVVETPTEITVSGRD